MHKVVIKGYYGFGNFGDDLLMITAYNIVKSIFPDHEIIIATESKNTQYIPKLIGSDVKVISQHNDVAVYWLIHGGGGVFFDFKDGGKKFWWLNKIIKAIGYPFFTSIYQSIQRARGRKNIQTQFRGGFGIGIGTYTDSSSKFYVDILSLSDFDFLLVRDAQSVKHIKRLKLDFAVHQATDIVFLQEHWNTLRERSGKANNNAIGVVLRDWPFNDNSYLAVMLNVCRQMKARGHQLKLFALDRATDNEFINRFEKDFSISVWDPVNTSVNEFITELASCSLMISSRAHGAIVAACLGLPTICLEIEPKLAAVSAMLPSSSALVKPDNEISILNVIDATLGKLEALSQAARVDADRNGEVMRGGVTIFREFVHESAKKR
jgi:polysaccharide pyruvyl transferase WcaK-like protein